MKMLVKKTRSNGDKLPISSTILNNLLKNILERQFTEAEKLIDQIESQIIREEGYSDFTHGFIYGLKGIILMYKTGEQNTFIGKLDLNNVDLLKKYYKEFLEHAENKLHGDYDRGYFLAIAKFLFFAIRNARNKKY